MHVRALFCLIFLLPPSFAAAQAPLNSGFDLQNPSTTAIKEIYARPHGSAKWGSRIPDALVAAGAKRAIHLATESNCIFDIRLVDEKGHAEEHGNVNVCTRSLVVVGDRKTALDSQ